MEIRRRSFNLRRPVLNELSSRSGSDQSSGEFIFIEDDNFINNDRNIINNSNSSRRSIPEEEIIIKTRGRKKTKCSPFLRDLSPNSLLNIKSPIKNSKNEELLKFLRSPTPRKCKFRDDIPLVEVKRAKKSLIADLEISNKKETKSNNTSTPSVTPTNNSNNSNKKKQSSNKKTPINSKKKKLFNLRRSTNVKS